MRAAMRFGQERPPWPSLAPSLPVSETLWLVLSKDFLALLFRLDPPTSVVRGLMMPAERALENPVRKAQWEHGGQQGPESTPILLAEVAERSLQFPGQMRVDFGIVGNRGIESMVVCPLLDDLVKVG